MTALHQMKCVACKAGELTVSQGEMYMMHPQIPDWMVKEADGIQRLERVFKFKSFAQALEFINKVSAIAEEEGHHPLIITEYGRVTADWWTHKIGGLHKNDFIMAAKKARLLDSQLHQGRRPDRAVPGSPGDCRSRRRRDPAGRGLMIE